MASLRQNKKIWKNAFIIYDVNSIPRNDGADLEKIDELARNYGLLLYDGELGDKPTIIPKRYSVKFRKSNV